MTEDATNPKDLVGRLKVDLSLLPAAAKIHAAHAMMDGARKYGAYNWRERAVKASVYLSAAERHLASWLDGEAVPADSGAHHLGHVIACCAIILDAEAAGKLVDDRPPAGAAAALLARLNAAIVEREKAKAAPNPSFRVEPFAGEWPPSARSCPCGAVGHSGPGLGA